MVSYEIVAHQSGPVRRRVICLKWWLGLAVCRGARVKGDAIGNEMLVHGDGFYDGKR